MARVSSIAEDDRVLDLVTQRRIYPMTAAFLACAAGRSMTLFIDHCGEMARFLSSGDEKSSNIMYAEMFQQLRKNKGLFCLVTKNVSTGNVPVEFHQMITLAYPPEELQMQQWGQELGNGVLHDDVLVDLVEKFPMHIPEIEFISRQSRVRAIMSGKSAPDAADVRHVITGYRGGKSLPLLFGGRERHV